MFEVISTDYDESMKNAERDLAAVRDWTKTPDDFVKYVEEVLGIELLECQKEVLQQYYELYCKNGPFKICYGLDGRIYAIPVDKEDVGL